MEKRAPPFFLFPFHLAITLVLTLACMMPFKDEKLINKAE